jgi:hypothetical protein
MIKRKPKAALLDRQPERPITRRHTPANALLEKALVNLCVIGQLREGDKLAFTADGFYLLQRPVGRVQSVWTTLSRLVSRTSRWQTLERVNDLIDSTTFFRDREDRERVEEAVRGALPGLRALQRTYADDALFVQNLEVLTDRIQRGFSQIKE